MNRRPRPDPSPRPDPRGPGYDPALPDEPTRVISRIEHEYDGEDELHLRETAYRTDRPPRPSNWRMIRKAQEVIWYAFGVLETLLALRFILLAVGANPANPFFDFVVGLTEPFAAPFANLVETPRLGASVLELGTIFGMIVYLLVAFGLCKLLELALNRDEGY